MKEWRKPNFFIIGAPKCGTTAMASYLDEHPEISISDPKEPHYLNVDLKYRPVDSLAGYERCFQHVTNDSIFIGDASVSYIYSSNAIDNIFNICAEPKLIVMIRNPIELSQSYHSEQVWSGAESEKDFQRAWSLQAERKKGKSIPRLCKDPFWLQYKEISLMGKYIKNLLSKVDRSQVHIVVLDDMKINPLIEYEKILTFLGVKSDGRIEFPIVNEKKSPKNRLVVPLMSWLISIKVKLGNPKINLGLIKSVLEWNKKEPKGKELDPEFNKILIEEFELDINLLSRLLKRDFSYWMK